MELVLLEYYMCAKIPSGGKPESVSAQITREMCGFQRKARKGGLPAVSHPICRRSNPLWDCGAAIVSRVFFLRKLESCMHSRLTHTG